MKLAHVVCLPKSRELNPSLDAAKSNWKRLSSSWYPPITIEVVGSEPPLTNPRHTTLSLTCTTEFAPYILQITFSFCRTREIVGTAAPRRVLKMLSVLKHAPKGATEATLVMFIAAASLINAVVTALKIEDSKTVYGFTVLIFVPPLPWLSMDNNVAFNGTVLSLILIDFTPMKYSAEGSP